MTLRDLWPTDSRDRLKVGFILAVIGCSTIWLVYFVSTHFESRKPAKVPNSPGWTAAHDVNSKLNADHAFVDVGVSVATEQPLKFVVKGAVFSNADLDRLPAVLKEIKPDAEYEFEVTVLKR